MKKIGRFLKGVIKGARDVSPVPSKDAENETVRRDLDAYHSWYELMGQKLTSRGVMVTALIYAVDQVFKLGLFS